MASSWRREDTMLGIFQSSAEAVRRARAFQARPPASDGVEMVPVPHVNIFFSSERIFLIETQLRLEYAVAIYHVIRQGDGAPNSVWNEMRRLQQKGEVGKKEYVNMWD
jgi:hypothetical protein